MLLPAQRPLLLACVAACLLAPATCAAQDEEDPRAEVESELEEVRAIGDYERAADLARELLDLARADSLAAPHEFRDAARRLETLEFACRLPNESRGLLATADSLALEGESLWQRGLFGDGEAVLERELEIRREVLGPEHAEVATTINNLAALKAAQGDIGGAEVLYEEALELKRRVLGESHPEVALAVNNMASLRYSRGDYAGAEALFREAVEILSTTLGEDDPFVTSCLLNLAGVMRARGDYAGAEPLYRKALADRRRVLGSDHPQSAQAMNALASVLKAKGDYSAAEPLYREALAIRRRELGESHPETAQSLNNLAAFLYAQGRFGEAEPLFREALVLRRGALGESHPEVAQSLNNLAAALYALESYAGAETLYEEALEMRRELLGEAHPAAATSLYNLGVLQKAKGDYETALETLARSYELRSSVLGAEHPDTATNLYTLAETRYLMGDCASADSLYRRSLEIRRSLLGRAHPHVAATLHRLGVCLKACGDYESAEQVLEEACEVYDAARLRAGSGVSRATFLDSPHADLAEAELELGKASDAWGPAERALGRTLTDLLVAASARGLTERERAIEDSLSRYLSECERNLAARRRAARESVGAEAAAVEDDSSAADEAAEDAAEISGVDAAEADEAVGDDAAPAAGDDPVVATEQARTALLEAEALWSKFQRDMSERHPVTEGSAADLTDVQSALTQDTAVVGWVDAEVGNDTYESWGYVIRNEGPVFWAKLGRTGGTAGPSIHESFRLYRRALSDAHSAPLGIRIDATALWEKRFSPLLTALGGVRNIALVASGAALGVPMETLVDGDGTLLGERYSVSYVPSSTLYVWLTDRAVQRQDGKASLLLGDPPFEGLLPDLPGSREEVAALAEVVDEPLVFLGPDASEEALFELVESGRLSELGVLHFATHAYVDDRVPERSSLLLSQSGLPDAVEAIATGQRVYDGVLTAREIVREWNLDADLVTLSACGTALGREAGGEGYLGLSHAFMQAGARSLLVSLWKVGDEATSLLMRRFYENLSVAGGGSREPAVVGEGLGGRTPRREANPARSKADALREAKLWLRNYADETGDHPYRHPFYWSAFVLVGNRC